MYLSRPGGPLCSPVLLLLLTNGCAGVSAHQTHCRYTEQTGTGDRELEGLSKAACSARKHLQGNHVARRVSGVDTCITNSKHYSISQGS